MSAQHSNASPEWYTPAPFVEAARAAMGGIDVDPASCCTANLTVRAPLYFTAERSGLVADAEWRGRVFLNPPGGLVREFWRRLLIEISAGSATSATWVGYSLEQLQTLQTDGPGPVQAARAICYCSRRIKFDVSDADRARMQAVLDAKNLAAGKPLRPWSNSPTHGNFFAYFGDNPVRFRRAFRQFGEVRL